MNAKRYMETKNIVRTTERQILQLRKEVNGTYTEEQAAISNGLKMINEQVRTEVEKFENDKKVCINYLIGDRSYNSQVVKIGKAYYKDGNKMTKAKGFEAIEEISTITEQMLQDDTTDKYYY